MPGVETERCALQPPQLRHEHALLNLYTDDQVRAFLGGPLSSDEAALRVNKVIANQRENYWMVEQKADSEPIGLISVGFHQDGLGYELSYQFLPSHWGRGLASEVLGATFPWALDALSTDVVFAETQTANTRSVALLVGLGLTLVRTIERFGATQGIYQFSR